jgi:hypothetical protein
MLLLGASVSMVYAGLDQGNRLDWLESDTVMALLLGGGMLFIVFLINETMVRQPWAHVNVLFSRNIGLSLVVILLYTLTSLSNSSLVPNFLSVVGLLRPEQSGVLLLIYGALPMFVLVPISTPANLPRGRPLHWRRMLHSHSSSCLGWLAESDCQPVVGIHQPDRDRQVDQFLFRERHRRRLEFAIRYRGVGDARDCFSPSQSRTFA